MRLDQLTFSRFLAAMAIVIYHYGVTVAPFNEESLNFIFKQANVGVSYFFILSGYVMVIAYDSKGSIDFWTFMRKRFARIYPAYAFAIVLILGHYLWTQTPVPLNQMALNMTMMQSWLPGHVFAFNYPSWSITVEMFFYVSFPFLFNWFYKRYSFKKIVITIITAFVLSQIAFHVLINSSLYKEFPSTSYQFMFYFPLLHFNEFLMGNLAGMLFLKYCRQLKNYDVWIILLLVFVILVLKFNMGINYHNGMLALFFVPMILLMSSNNGLLTRISKIKALVFLGEISYGIYILQYPIFSWTETIMKSLKMNNPTLIFYCGVVFLIVASAISFKCIEGPFQNLINNVFLKQNKKIKA